jgi:hypothetical protein
MRRSIHALLVGLALGGPIGLVGCASTEDAPPRAVETASLTVIVWSAQMQAAVPAVGTVTSKADGTSHEIDTRSDPASGCRVAGLQPGAFEVKIARRFDRAGKPQNVDGVEQVYLEPGATKELTVVATDRGGEVGYLFPSTPDAPPSPRPLTAARPGGG